MPSNTICQRFIYGRCPFSALACTHSHSKEHAPICRMWQKGFCIGATGNACRFRHYYNEMDGSVMQAARQAQRPAQECANQLETYNSPYRVKVIKEVAKQRKEEVDLETGKRKSWVETTEFEVLDLTGDTPAKKTRLSLSKSPLKEVNKQKEVEKVKKSLAAVSKPAAPAPADPGTCPVCARKFKGEKGVSSHRRARNSACHPDKENLTRNQNQAVAVTPVSSRRAAPRTGPVLPYTPGQDDSIILIPDTPVPGNRRASLRRSIRMA